MNFKLILLILLIGIFYLGINNQSEHQVARSKAPVKTINAVEINFYTTEWCPYCKSARNYMLANNIDFTEYDIEKSALGKVKHERIIGEMGLKIRTGVPLFEINDERFYGWSEANFNRVINAQKYK